MRTGAILKETLVAFKRGSKLQGAPSSQSLWRWASRGLKKKCDGNGRPITLEYCYVGGRLHTSTEAYQRWLDKINDEV